MYDVNLPLNHLLKVYTVQWHYISHQPSVFKTFSSSRTQPKHILKSKSMENILERCPGNSDVPSSLGIHLTDMGVDSGGKWVKVFIFNLMVLLELSEISLKKILSTRIFSGGLDRSV